jgi:hypothetical protein
MANLDSPGLEVLPEEHSLLIKLGSTLSSSSVSGA